jgi:hypothetical protein
MWCARASVSTFAPYAATGIEYHCPYPGIGMGTVELGQFEGPTHVGQEWPVWLRHLKWCGGQSQTMSPFASLRTLSFRPR